MLISFYCGSKNTRKWYEAEKWAKHVLVRHVHVYFTDIGLDCRAFKDKSPAAELEAVAKRVELDRVTYVHSTDIVWHTYRHVEIPSVIQIKHVA